MKWLLQFGRFWYDFIVGDDWRIAVGVVITTTVVFVRNERADAASVVWPHGGYGRLWMSGQTRMDSQVE